MAPRIARLHFQPASVLGLTRTAAGWTIALAGLVLLALQAADTLPQIDDSLRAAASGGAMAALATALGALPVLVTRRIGADVQGSTLMSETLAQYSALMVMEKEYGRDKMNKFLDHELNRYLMGRATERHRELPLVRVENQPYIHYNKGSLVMYTLREYLGEEVLNAALASYIRKVGFQQPPYTISTDLVQELRAVTPERYAYLIEDLFETITIYDNRTTDVSVTERPDGKFDVTMQIQTRKYRADERGAETAVDLDDWIPIGVLGEDEAGERVPLYEELHHLTGDSSEITVTVDRRPKRAGVDPRVLLIDRNPDDNIVRVR